MTFSLCSRALTGKAGSAECGRNGKHGVAGTEGNPGMGGGKGKEQAARGLKLVFGGAAVPDARKTMRDGVKAVVHACHGFGGDDAYFIGPSPCSMCTTIGVADGVHMWREKGVDSGAFSRSLMRECQRCVSSLPSSSVLPCLRSTLSHAYTTVVHSGITGSCTACLVAVCHQTGSVRAANIGDSGWLLLSHAQLPRRTDSKRGRLRDAGGHSEATSSGPATTVAAASSTATSTPASNADAATITAPDERHSGSYVHSRSRGALNAAAEACNVADVEYGTTHATGVARLDATHHNEAGASSQQLEVKSRSTPLEHHFGWPFQLGTHPASDSASDANECEFTMRDGDVLLVGTDGLWDNLHESEVAEEAERSLNRGAAAVARSLASRAYESSLDQDRITPYALHASNEFEMVYHGGKRDDIAVVCALAKSNDTDA